MFEKKFSHNRFGGLTIRTDGHTATLNMRQLLDVLKVPTEVEADDTFESEFIAWRLMDQAPNFTAVPWVTECIHKATSEEAQRLEFMKSKAGKVVVQ